MTTYIYDNDLAYPETLQDLCNFLEELTDHNLRLTYWKTDGPGGGNPNFRIEGTRTNLVKWYLFYYNPEFSITHNPTSEEEVWADMEHRIEELGWEEETLRGQG